MIKAVLFDCFGVLITDVLKGIVADHAEDDPGGAADIQAIIAAANLGVISRAESNQRAADILGMTVAEYRARIDGGEVRNERLFAYSMLLREQGYKTAMLSNISKESLDRRFQKAELQRYFDEVITSGEVGFAKPEPEIYELAADRLGVRCDECVFTDDRERFCEGAQATGMKTIVYTDFIQFTAELEQMIEVK